MDYELCVTCEKPLINEENLRRLRKNWIKWGILGLLFTTGCGVLGAFALPLLGFGSGGIAAGSFAASWQGPAVAAGSVFAICQSLGATGLGILLFGAVGTGVGASVSGALGLIYRHRVLFDWCSCN